MIMQGTLASCGWFSPSLTPNPPASLDSDLQQVKPSMVTKGDRFVTVGKEQPCWKIIQLKGAVC